MNFRLYIKIALIIGLMIVLMIPLAMIDGVVDERSRYREQVMWDVARTWTGQQSIKGPVLMLPYELKYDEKVFNKETEKYELRTVMRTKTLYVIPDELEINGSVDTENRQRGIYSVPVYSSAMKLNGHFATDKVMEQVAKIKGFERWLKPSLNLVIDDVRGIGSSPKLQWNKASAEFVAGSRVPNLSNGIHALLPLIPASGQLPFSIEFDLRGSQSLMITPLAKDVNTKLLSSWPHPKFDGEFLPVSHDITDAGFAATWQTSSFSTDAQKKLKLCVVGECSSLNALRFGVEFIEPVNIYAKVNRAIKYGILFVVLTFVAFFLTETLSSKQLHPVQYCLVGFALAMFYLLLMSLSEHFGFVTAYLAATAASAMLIGAYMSGVLSSKKLGAAYSAAIALLYAMLFAILRSEDFALLMGSLLLFVMLAVVMLLTRKVNWYQIGKPAEIQKPIENSAL